MLEEIFSQSELDQFCQRLGQKMQDAIAEKVQGVQRAFAVVMDELSQAKFELISVEKQIEEKRQELSRVKEQVSEALGELRAYRVEKEKMEQAGGAA
jgi:chromosome segregation ATPase